MLQPKIKPILFFYFKIIIVWVLAFFILLFLRNSGSNLNTLENPLRNLNPAQLIAVIFSVGGIAGVMYASIELLFDRPYFQRHSYGRIILSKAIFSFFAVKLLMVIAIALISTFMDTWMELAEVIIILRSKVYWVVFVYFIMVASLISFVRMVSQKFGPGILWNMFIGRYRNPREEQRIFMFLDLKSSTTIAEKLGHIKFSRLIQNCFADLTPVVTKHKVEIYQYVGDEAVLSWPIESGFESNRCIHCYFDYMAILASKADYYEKEYGLQPFFKAGLHLGNVIVAEVGLIKREIAYHGDVLNTTARIQSLCNQLKQKMLISEEVLKHLSPDHEIQSDDLGEELLKGKKSAVTIYAIKKI